MKRKIREAIKEDKEEKDSLHEIKFKSQAAMEYLMTYGWAILIIALTLAVLYSLGIMNPKNFLPRAPPGSCFVFRPNGPGTTDFVSLQGTCGYLPMYVGSFGGNYITVPNSPFIRNYSNGVTVCLWFKANIINISQGQFGQNGPGYLNFWMPAGTTTTYLRWETDGGQNFYSNTLIYPNKWYFACGVYNTSASSNQAKLYINGVLDKQATLTFTTTKTADITIGGYGPGSYLFNGFIGNVQVYTTPLTPQEIQYLYQEGLGGAPIRLGSLVGWWPLNGDAKDYSGNNNNGIIYRGVTFVQNYNPP